MQQKIGVYSSNNPLVGSEDIHKGVNLVLSSFIPKIKEKCEEIILRKLEPIMSNNINQIQTLKQEIDRCKSKYEEESNVDKLLLKDLKDQCIELNKEIKQISKEGLETSGKKRKFNQHLNDNISLQLEEFNSLIEDTIRNTKWNDESEPNRNEQYEEIRSLVKTKFDQLHLLLCRMLNNTCSIPKEKIQLCINTLDKVFSTRGKVTHNRASSYKAEVFLSLSKDIVDIPKFFYKKRKII